MRTPVCPMLVVAVLLVTCATVLHAYEEVKLYVEGELMELSPPGLLIDGQPMLPALPFLQVMGAQVSWDQPRQAVIAEKPGVHLVMVMGEKDRLVNDQVETRNTPPQLVDGVPYVTLRFAPQHLGYRFKWDRGARTAHLSAKGGQSGANQLISLRPAAVPELLWVGEGDYKSGGVSPIGGSATQAYSFQVLYRHPDGRYPESIFLFLSPGPGGEAGWHYYRLEEVRRLGEGYEDGVVYGVTLQPGYFEPGAKISYFFQATDGTHTLIR